MIGSNFGPTELGDDFKNAINNSFQQLSVEAQERDAKEAFFRRVENLYTELSEKTVDADANLSSNRQLLSEVFQFISEHSNQNLRGDSAFSEHFKETLGYVRAVSIESEQLGDIDLFAEAAFIEGRLHESNFDYMRALSLYDKALMNGGETHKYFIAAAIVSRKMSETHLAAQYLDAVLSKSSALPEKSIERSRALNERGGIHESEFELLPAIEAFYEAELILAESGENEVLRHRIMNNIAHCFLSNNDPVAAIYYSSRSFRFFKDARFDNRLDYISVCQTMAETLRKSLDVSRNDERWLYEDVRKAFLTTGKLDAAKSLLAEFGDSAIGEAEDILRSSVSFCRNSYSQLDAHPSLAHALNNLGTFVASEYRDFEEATKLLDEAMSMTERMFTENNPRLIPMLINSAVIGGMISPGVAIRKLDRAKRLASKIYAESDEIFLVIQEERGVLEKRLH